MNDQRNQQARFLHDTIRMMQRRFPHPPSLSRDRVNGKREAFPDLTMPQLNMLMTCHDIGPTTIKEIAEALDVSAPSVSAMVERLVEFGAVTREQHAGDRRQVVVTLTEAGAATVLRMEEYMVGALAEVLDRIGPEYAQKWCDVYREINRVYGGKAPELEMQREGVVQ